MALDEKLQYLHFGILEFPLNQRTCQMTSALKFISWNAGHLEGAEQASGAANDDPRGRPMCMCTLW